MANLLILKRRIKTAENVSKTTRAMQMIAASKLKRAEQSALSSRPYVEKLTQISRSISQKVDEEEKNDYMRPITPTDEKLIILVSPDKGLCGGLNTNLARELLKFTKENKKLIYITVGKKASGIVRSFGGNILASFEIGTTLPSYDLVYPVMALIDEQFLGRKVSSVYTLNSNFNSFFSQNPLLKKILPVQFESEEELQKESLFEPSAKTLLPGLIRHYLEMSIYQSFLENYLSEQAARMIAMQNATENAKEIIEELKLLYNKKRQEKITSEILDISGGVFINA